MNTTLTLKNTALTSPFTNAIMNTQDTVYYRSKIFTPKLGENALINAASPIISMITRLHSKCPSLTAHTLHHELLHEMKAFESNIQHYHGNQELANTAYLFLCIWIDTFMKQAPWLPKGHWEPFQLLQVLDSSKHPESPDTVIENTIQKALESPEAYIDIIELIYLGYSLGYQGNYPSNLELHQARLEELYACIQHTNNTHPKASILPKCAPPKQTHTASPWATLAFSIFTCLSLFLSMHLGLSHIINTLSASFMLS